MLAARRLAGIGVAGGAFTSVAWADESSKTSGNDGESSKAGAIAALGAASCLAGAGLMMTQPKGRHVAAKFFAPKIAFGGLALLAVGSGMSMLRSADNAGSAKKTQKGNFFTEFIFPKTAATPARSEMSFTLLNDSFRFAESHGKFNALLSGLTESEPTESTAGLAKDQCERPTVYVIDIDPSQGGASLVADLSDKVSYLLSTASKEKDEIVLRVRSPGGSVVLYGALSAEADRLTKAGLSVTACVDEVAASGGYMIACTASQIFASPFAIVGSIGVVAEFPNINKGMKRHGIEWESFTGGECKRTVGSFDDASPQAREKMQEQIDEVHTAFTAWVVDRRSEFNPANANGEHWIASKAPPGLVDQIITSSCYLKSKMDDSSVVLVEISHNQSLAEQLGFPSASLNNLVADTLGVSPLHWLMLAMR